MKVGKVVSFLLLRPAFTGRNLTSLTLVAVFFGVYVMAGGKVTTVPSMPAGSGFGSVEKGEAAVPTAEQRSETRKRNVSNRLNKLFGTGNNAEPQAAPEAAPSPATRAEAPKVDGGESGDGLDALEARLKGLSGKRGN